MVLASNLIHVVFRVERLAEILGRFRHCAFSHVRRRANQVADKLANQGVKVVEKFNYTSWPPQDEPGWASQINQTAREDNQDPGGADMHGNPPVSMDTPSGGRVNPPHNHQDQ